MRQQDIVVVKPRPQQKLMHNKGLEPGIDFSFSQLSYLLDARCVIIYLIKKHRETTYAFKSR